MLGLSPVVLFMALFIANSASPRTLSQFSIPSVNLASIGVRVLLHRSTCPFALGAPVAININFAPYSERK
uniref:Putative secreted protein n=1 Tax=Xenopsylla cheopis TaxID=163159 RepID=A0A6M2DVE6_XENCH